MDSTLLLQTSPETFSPTIPLSNMMKLAILAVLVAAASASGLVSSQRAVINHHTLHGYGNGVSSRYFDKAETGLGLGYGRAGLGLGGLGLGLGGLGVGGLGGLGLGVGGLGLGRIGGLGLGRIGGLGLGGVAYDGIDNLGLAYNNYDLADGRLGLGGLGRVGLGGVIV